MCGRYSVVKKRLPKEHRLASQMAGIEDSPHYNAAPSQKLPVIIKAGGGIEFFKWGLVPAWAKDLKTTKPINARAETITTSPMFNRLIRSKRCLIPADSFYEWQVKEVPEITLFDLPATPKKTNLLKKPFRIMRRDEDLFTFAGLWDEWLDKSTGELLKNLYHYNHRSK
jgi:putative SOS response-associated peptidase YedK